MSRALKRARSNSFGGGRRETTGFAIAQPYDGRSEREVSRHFFKEGIEDFCAIDDGRVNRDGDCVKRLEPLALSPNFFGAVAFPFGLFLILPRQASYAFDLREVAVEERNHQRKKHAQIIAGISGRLRIENAVRINQRRQQRHNQQAA